jgi:hypothetical protein
MPVVLKAGLRASEATALRQWLQAAEKELDGPFEGDIFRRFYRGESLGESAMTAQYVSTVLKRHAESAASKSTPGTPRGRRSTSTSRKPGPFGTIPPRRLSDGGGAVLLVWQDTNTTVF